MPKSVDGIKPITGGRDERKNEYLKYGSAILNLIQKRTQYGYSTEDIMNYIKGRRDHQAARKSNFLFRNFQYFKGILHPNASGLVFFMKLQNNLD